MAGEVAVIENVRPGPRHLTQAERDMDLTNELEQRQPARGRRKSWDSEEAKKDHRQLMDWYLLERERQSVNRFQMAIDEDFYDNLQWDDADADEVEARGQKPIVFNEVAPMCDWVIGTERRAKTDWRVLPRAEDDVQTAAVKQKVLKYVSDVNSTPFIQSKAFSSSIKAGVAFLESAIQTDPTKELLVNRWESWRRVLWDSAALQEDLDDGRFMFRWRWVDLDLAEVMFPDRKDALRRQAFDKSWIEEEIDEDAYYLNQRLSTREMPSYGRRVFVADSATLGFRRERVKIIEGWYRQPTRVKYLMGDPRFEGQVFDPADPIHRGAVSQGIVSAVDTIAMRMHLMLMTDKDVLRWQPSPYRHNRFPFTPIWCYRRSRDGMPYGLIRRVRDVQEDLNKRMSKALFALSTNQILAEEGAVDDWQVAREEADAPDGVIIKRKGKEFELLKNQDVGKGQMELALFDVQKIQNSGGVNQDNLGRQTNAESGKAIEARQLQGAVTTTEPFDNLRFAKQKDGEKQLSLIEQFYTAPKVFRLTGDRKSAIEWVKVNQPEIQADGSIRWLNDITASQADFIMSEQDFHGTLRQAMFDAMKEVVQKMPDPMLAIRLMKIAFEYSDLPNKDEIVAELRKTIGEPETDEPRTPEEAAEREQLIQAQQRAMARNEEMAQLAVEELRAKVAKTNSEATKILADADKIKAEAAAAGAEQGLPPEVVAQIEALQKALVTAQDDAMQQRLKADQQAQKLVQQLAKVTAELNNRTLEVGKTHEASKYTADKDVEARKSVAEIEARAQVEVAKLAKQADESMDKVLKAVGDIAKRVDALAKEVADAQEAAKKEAKERAEAEKKEKAEAKERERTEKEEKREAAKVEREEKAAAKAEAKAEPPVINVTVPVTVVKDGGTRTIEIKKTKDGFSGTASDTDDKTPK